MLDTAVCSKRFKEIHRVLSKMKRNHEHLIIKTNPALLLYSTIMLQKEEEEHQVDIRYSLRCMAQLIIEIRKNPGQEKVNGNDLDRPQNYDIILEATKVLSIYKSPRDVSKPSVFLKIEFPLKNFTLYLGCVALRECNPKSIEEIRNFLELQECDWQIYAGNARATYESRKANIPEELPIESDVRIFRDFIVSEIGRITKKITCGPVILSDVKDLAMFILARIMTFNA